jgi:hypothetical protein
MDTYVTAMDAFFHQYHKIVPELVENVTFLRHVGDLMREEQQDAG